MFCNNCGAKVKDGAAFCPMCGTKLQSGAPSNQYVTTEPESGAPNNRYVTPETGPAAGTGYPANGAAGYNTRGVNGTGFNLSAVTEKFKKLFPTKKSRMILAGAAIALLLIIILCSGDGVSDYARLPDIALKSIYLNDPDDLLDVIHDDYKEEVLDSVYSSHKGSLKKQLSECLTELNEDKTDDMGKFTVHAEEVEETDIYTKEEIDRWYKYHTGNKGSERKPKAMKDITYKRIIETADGRTATSELEMTVGKIGSRWFICDLGDLDDLIYWYG